MERDLHAARPQVAPPGREPGPQYVTPYRCAVCGLPIEWRGGGAFRHVARLDDEVSITRERGRFRVIGHGADASLTCWGPLGTGRERTRSFSPNRVKIVHRKKIGRP